MRHTPRLLSVAHRVPSPVSCIPSVRTLAVRLAVAILLAGHLPHTRHASTLQAQSARTRVPTESLVHDAREKASVGDTSAALELLERATDQSPRDPDALYWRGLVLSRTTALTIGDTPRRILAWHLLNRANSIDARNPRYLLELGRLRLNTPILRVEAERLFRRALSVAEQNGDPSQLADVAYELGQIKARRYLTGKNRWLYSSNLIFDPIVSQRRLHYTREFLQQLSRPIENAAFVDRSQAEEYFRRALAAVPAHEQSATALAALLYDQRRFDELQRIVAPVLQLPGASARPWLAAGLAAYRLGELAAADRFYTAALARLTPQMKDNVLNLGRILRKGDSVRVLGLNAADRARTDSAFWESADPLLATPENEARLEYLSRIAFTDLFFTDSDTRQIGWNTDRGLIIARYGEPPVIATFPPSSDADAGDAIGRIITVWFYPRAEVEFVFFGPPAMNSASFAGNYRDFAEERRDASPFMLDNVPLAMSIDSLPTQVTRFRGANVRETEVLVATSIDAARMYRGAEIDRGVLERSVRVGPAARLQVASVDTMRVSLPASRRLQWLFVDTLRAGEYRMRFEARDPSVTGAFGRAQLETVLSTSDTAHLGSSDLLIADRVAVPPTTLRSWHQLGLVPRGDLVMAPRDTFSLYWENYGLRANAGQRVSFEVRIVVTLLQLDRGRDPLRNLFGNISDAVGLSPEGDEQLGMRYERTEAVEGRDRIPGLVTLGLGTAPSGRYRLTVTVSDRVSGQRTSTQREFTISRAGP